MLTSFKNNLSKVTDLTILFASIFTFLAFITPKELSLDPIETSREILSSQQTELRSINESLENNQIDIATAQTTIEEINSRIITLDSELDFVIIQDLNSQLSSVAQGLIEEQSQNKLILEEIKTIESSIARESLEIRNLENELNNSKSISWIQPVRQNVEAFAYAAGMDGLLVGFSALIFCLVCKRRKEWFKKMFRLYS